MLQEMPYIHAHAGSTILSVLKVNKGNKKGYEVVGEGVSCPGRIRSEE